MISIKSLSLVIGGIVAMMLPVAAQEKVDFERQVFPILKNNCQKCHWAPRKDARGRLRTAKGGLRLDGKGFILAGGSTAGKAVIPKSSSASLLYSLVSLPADDLDIMPPEGSPLKAKEVELIGRWIDEGAEFGAWQGAGGPPPAKKTSLAVKKVDRPAMIKVYEGLAEGLEALPSSALKIAIVGVKVESLYPASPLLRVSFPSQAQKIGDASLAAFLLIAGRIAVLDLGKTSVTDKGMKHLAKMKRLVRLDLSQTSITSTGVKSLQHLNELRSLVLWGTKTSDTALPTLTMLPRLQRLYLWRTEVTDAGLQRFKLRKPEVKVSSKLLWPQPRQAPESGNQRRRRRQN